MCVSRYSLSFSPPSVIHSPMYSLRRISHLRFCLPSASNLFNSLFLTTSAIPRLLCRRDLLASAFDKTIPSGLFRRPLLFQLSFLL